MSDLASVIHEVFCRENAPMHSSPDHSASRVLAKLPDTGELARLREAASLDEAWAAAESALPNGEAHRGHPLYRFGHWRMKVIGPWDIEHDGHRPTYQAIADPYNATGVGLDREIEALGPTPAAALQALRAALTVQHTEEEE